MSKRRMIHDSFFQSEGVAEWSMRQRLLVLGMIAIADDQGRLKGNPLWIRAQIFPYDPVSPAEISTDLEVITSTNDTLQLYQVDGRSYIQFIHWWDYQQPQWVKASECPAPDGWQDRVRQMVYKPRRWIMTINWPETEDRTAYEASRPSASESGNESGDSLGNELGNESGDAVGDALPITNTNTNTNTNDLIGGSRGEKLPPLPSFIASSALLNTWGEWVQYQIDSGHPLTFRTAKGQHDKFIQWGEERSIVAMTYSMDQGYKGLVEPKTESNERMSTRKREPASQGLKEIEPGVY